MPVPHPPTLIAVAFVGVVVGGATQAQLAHLRYRHGDEVDLPKPPTGWVIPATVLLSLAIWWVIAPGRPVIVPITYVIASWAMVPLAFIDLDVHRLPDRIQLPAYPILVLLLFACSVATGRWGAFGRALLAGAALWLLFLAMALLLPGGAIGFGDVKLAGLLGLLLGWLSWAQVIAATIATFLLGGLVAAALLLTRRKRLHDEFAYGPSMLLGALIALLAPLALQGLT